MKFKKTQLTFVLGLALICACALRSAHFGRQTFAPKIDSNRHRATLSQILQLNDTVFEKGVYEVEPPIVYRLFKPTNEPGRQHNVFPLVVVFHGSGAIGSNNSTQLGFLAKLFAGEHSQTKYPAYVLAPQFSTRSSDYTVDSVRKVLSSKPRANVLQVCRLVDSLKKVLPIDENRIYVAGFSMGGSTTINALLARPDLFAAGISLSGIPQFTNIQTLRNTPIWLIHGTIDNENPIDSDELFYNELKDKGKVRFWRLNGLGHNNVLCPELTGLALPDWLFQQRK